MQRIDLGKRLIEERKRLGMNQTDFGRIGSVSKGSQILYEKGDGVPTGDYLAAIAVAGADVQYVLTGVRSSVALTPEERLLVERFRSSGQGLRDAALRVLLGDSSQQSAIQESAPAVGKIGGSGHRFSIRGDYYEQGKPKK